MYSCSEKNICALKHIRALKNIYLCTGNIFVHILGDPGAVSWVDKIMSMVKVYCNIETSPWAITLTEQVPEAVELPASDWPEKFFLANQRRGAAG